MIESNRVAFVLNFIVVLVAELRDCGCIPSELYFMNAV
jgi:hypothetical protein